MTSWRRIESYRFIYGTFRSFRTPRRPGDPWSQKSGSWPSCRCRWPRANLCTCAPCELGPAACRWTQPHTFNVMGWIPKWLVIVHFQRNAWDDNNNLVLIIGRATPESDLKRYSKSITVCCDNATNLEQPGANISPGWRLIRYTNRIQPSPEGCFVQFKASTGLQRLVLRRLNLWHLQHGNGKDHQQPPKRSRKLWPQETWWRDETCKWTILTTSPESNKGFDRFCPSPKQLWMHSDCDAFR